MLLGRIVEQVSGESLGGFLDRRIFAPLGMTMTRHTPSTTRVGAGPRHRVFPAADGWRMRALHNFPLHGEGGLVSSVEDLALWHAQFGLPRAAASALATALTTMTPFVNGAPNTYARGLRMKTWRGVRTVGHDGLWPGFKTSFVRLPDHHAAVICISNDATSDPHDLAFQVVDALIEGAPGVHPVPPMPDWAATRRWPGVSSIATRGATVDVARDAKDRVTASVNGVATFLRADRGWASGDQSRLRRFHPAFRWRVDRGGTRRGVTRDTASRRARRAPAGGPARALCQSGYRRDLDHHRRSTPARSCASPARCCWRAGHGRSSRSRVTSFVSTRRLTLYRGWLDTRVLRDAAGVSPVCTLMADGRRGWCSRGLSERGAAHSAVEAGSIEFMRRGSPAITARCEVGPASPGSGIGAKIRTFCRESERRSIRCSRQLRPFSVMSACLSPSSMDGHGCQSHR